MKSFAIALNCVYLTEAVGVAKTTSYCVVSLLERLLLIYIIILTYNWQRYLQRPIIV